MVSLPAVDMARSSASVKLVVTVSYLDAFQSFVPLNSTNTCSLRALVRIEVVGKQKNRINGIESPSNGKCLCLDLLD